jgi:hypothetical protein
MRSRQLSPVLRRPRVLTLAVLLVLQTVPTTSMAQQEVTVYSLPVASVSTRYHVNIQQVLRENYTLKLQSTAQEPNFRWFFHSGALPAGLRITPDGNIIGLPRSARTEPYKFNVRVFDSIGSSDELILTLELRVEATRIRLVSTGAPKLVPVSEESTPNENGTARITLGDRIAPPWNANHSQVNTSTDVVTQRREPARSYVSADAEFTRSSASLPSASTTAVASAPAAADPSNPPCLPDPTPDPKNDFIINARTGEIGGKKKFGLKDNARIIVVEKNPFLYEYKVTLKDKAIVESAIGDFFSGWALLADNLDASKAEATKKSGEAGTKAPSCPQLRLQYGGRVAEIERLRDRLSQWVEYFKTNYTREQTAYEAVVQNVETYKKALYDSNANCTTVGTAAINIRSAIQAYKPDLDTLTKEIDRFKRDAESLQQEVEDLMEAVRNDPRPIPEHAAVTGDDCRRLLNEHRAVAVGYVKIANDLETGIEKIKAGKKEFDKVVKTINNVFSNPNAFYQVYTRGEYGLPTDVEITVERKDITKAGGDFVKIIDAVKINFGGGPRFAIAGGVVASPFETINFKRVPALINGQPTTIIGQDESSNSRILPILMLHGRFAEGRGPISGFHFSLGVTAKPTDSGTNVEFLIGPSISFIEERLFFTIGGYAGRRKQLEGNLFLGQELPKEFTDEIPTSNHLVWKPGFALTYKFK